MEGPHLCQSCGHMEAANVKEVNIHGTQHYLCDLCEHNGAGTALHYGSDNEFVLAAISYTGNEILARLRDIENPPKPTTF
jgi:hypothetical protein